MMPHIDIATTPGIDKKASTPALVCLQHSLAYISNAYADRTHICTDGSTTTASAASAFVVPTKQITCPSHLSHWTNWKGL